MMTKAQAMWLIVIVWFVCLVAVVLLIHFSPWKKIYHGGFNETMLVQNSIVNCSGCPT